MALQWKWSDKMGKITIKQREKVYDVNIYAGNALAIFICEYEQMAKRDTFCITSLQIRSIVTTSSRMTNSYSLTKL